MRTLRQRSVVRRAALTSLLEQRALHSACRPSSRLSQHSSANARSSGTTSCVRDRSAQHKIASCLHAAGPGWSGCLVKHTMGSRPVLQTRLHQAAGLNILSCSGLL